MSNRAASCSRNARLLGDAASRRRKEGGREQAFVGRAQSERIRSLHG